MARIGFKRVLHLLPLSISPSSGATSSEEDEDSNDRKGLLRSHLDQILAVGGLADGIKALALHLEPKTVVLKVSMHCNGCARKVEKHISKMEGVTSFEVDLESKKVVVVGDITPMEVWESISKVKFAELVVAS